MGGEEKSWGLWHEHRGSLRRYTLQGRSCLAKLSWLKDLRELQQRSGLQTNSKCFLVKCIYVFFSNDLKENSLTKLFYLCDPIGPPAFETLLSDCTTKTAETIKLTCKVTGSPKPVVSWLKGRDIQHGVLQNIQSDVLFHLTIFLMVSTCKDGLPLEDDPRHIISADRAGSCCLILDSLTAQDAGQYTCYASSFMGSAATLAKVVVQGESCFCRVKMPRFC